MATFSGCRITGNANGFVSATLNLYDEYGALPDQSVGSKTNTCGSSDWGVMTRSDGYHWTLDKFNGGVDSALRLYVSSVKQTY